MESKVFSFIQQTADFVFGVNTARHVIVVTSMCSQLQ